MTIVIVVIIMLTSLAAYVTTLGYNQRKLANSSGARRVLVYFRAQAGVVWAYWRIRANYTNGLIPLASAQGFLVDAYDPNPYNIDVDGDTVMDCTVDIGPATGVTKQRAILSTGLDV